MKRRSFLLATAAAAVWPASIRRAFADASLDAPGAAHPSPSLAAARARARQAHRPLLIIVIPADYAARYARGELWGEYLNHGSRADLAPLAQAELSCATMKELRPFAPGSAGEPLAVVLEPGGGARVLDARVPDYESLGRDWSARKEAAVSARRIAVLARLMRRALGMPADPQAAGARVIRAWRATPPPGSHWARHSGCGPATVEGMKNEGVGMLCGMGHVPEKSARFLYFFTRPPLEVDEWMDRRPASGDE